MGESTFTFRDLGSTVVCFSLVLFNYFVKNQLSTNNSRIDETK